MSLLHISHLRSLSNQGRVTYHAPSVAEDTVLSDAIKTYQEKKTKEDTVIFGYNSCYYSCYLLVWQKYTRKRTYKYMPHFFLDNFSVFLNISFSSSEMKSVFVCLSSMSHQQHGSYGDGTSVKSLITRTGKAKDWTSNPWFTRQNDPIYHSSYFEKFKTFRKIHTILFLHTLEFWTGFLQIWQGCNVTDPCTSLILL